MARQLQIVDSKGWLNIVLNHKFLFSSVFCCCTLYTYMCIYFQSNWILHDYISSVFVCLFLVVVVSVDCSNVAAFRHSIFSIHSLWLELCKRKNYTSISLYQYCLLLYNTIQYNFIAKCQYNCTRNVLWCQVHSSHIHSNHTTLNYKQQINIQVKSHS